MATYLPTLISINNVGGTAVTIQENNGSGTLNQLLANTGNEVLIMDSMDFFSPSSSQVQQPIEFTRKALDGNLKTMIKIPSLDRYQLNNAIHGMKADNFPVDTETFINYTIEPNTFVKLTLNVNKKVRPILSYTRQLDQAVKRNMFWDMMKDRGFKEVDEIPTWDGRPEDDFRELQEIRFFPADGEKPIIYKPVKKNGNELGLGLLLIAASFIIFVAGKGKGMYKF